MKTKPESKNCLKLVPAKTGVVATRRGVEVYEINPFLDGFEITTRKRSQTVDKGTAYIESRKTGEMIEGETTLQEIKQVDNEQFVKLFSSHIKIWFDLSQTANKVFYVLLVAIQQSPMTDKIFLNSEIASDYFKQLAGKPLSSSVYQTGLRELVKKKIIAHSKTQGFFFINPAVVFNGNRARFIVEIQKKSVKQSNPPITLVALDDAA